MQSLAAFRPIILETDIFKSVRFFSIVLVHTYNRSYLSVTTNRP